ncbi:hypothetical protein CDAR_525361 [Caerostris darwini]|uniref:Uncharacterized protein n=1 Tax=Caerostris darwini TaxID=1538125 RepID=A0AAV4RJJ8_9ARAC|nr:hypothetical protein CDAR_525361 [Caerostris darwini]
MDTIHATYSDGYHYWKAISRCISNQSYKECIRSQPLEQVLDIFLQRPNIFHLKDEISCRYFILSELSQEKDVMEDFSTGVEEMRGKPKLHCDSKLILHQVTHLQLKR